MPAGPEEAQKERGHSAHTRVVHIRGDTEAVYGEVVAVMDRLATNGITHIAIMTNSRSKTGPASKGAAGRPAPTQVPAAVPAGAAK